MYDLIIYFLTIILLCISFFKDKDKTIRALKKCVKSFKKVLPQFLSILLFVNILLEVLSPEVIEKVIGSQSGVLGMITSGIIGSITLVPVLIAFPIASQLLNNGAGIMQIIVFISTLTTVGIATAPLEVKYLGKKVTILRNVLLFICSFIVAYIAGEILS